VQEAVVTVPRALIAESINLTRCWEVEAVSAGSLSLPRSRGLDQLAITSSHWPSSSHLREAARLLDGSLPPR
jgi:hypothetical protein